MSLLFLPLARPKPQHAETFRGAMGANQATIPASNSHAQATADARF